MRTLKLPRRRWAVTTAVAVVSALSCAPAFADYSIVAVSDRGYDVGVAIAGCDKNEIAHKPVLVPAVGAAVANTTENKDSHAAFLYGLRTSTVPGNYLEEVPVSGNGTHSFAMAKIKKGTAVLAKNGGSSTTPTAVDAQATFVVSGDNLASPAVSAAAVKAYKATAGNLAQKLVAALAAAEKAGGDAACSGKASAAALLMAKPNDAIFNVYEFLPKADFTKELVPINDKHLPRVFVSALTTDGSSAVTKVTDALEKADFTKPVHIRKNAAADQASLLKFALLCFGGATAAIVLILLYRRRVMTAEAETAGRSRRSGNPAKR